MLRTSGHALTAPRPLSRAALIGALALSVLASGCGTMARNRPAAAVAGFAVAALGVGLIASGPEAVDSDDNGVNDFSLNDNYASPVFGSILLAAGLGIAITALVSSEPAPAAAPALTLAAPATPATAPAGPGAPLAEGPLPPLPELPATATVLRLAKQVRSIAHRGECRAAQATLIELASYDADYARALAAGPVMAPCPPTP